MTGFELLRQFLPRWPLPAQLGVRLDDLAPDRATLSLPFAAGNTTVGDVVHGGAIATLADCAVAAAAFATDELPEPVRGTTVSLTLTYADAARGEDLTAHGRVVRRGRSLCTCEADVHGADGRPVAKAVATYKLG